MAKIAAQNKNPAPSSYVYDLEIVGENDEKSVKITNIPCDQIGRKKNSLSKDRLKLFVKQHCRVGSDGFWKVKDALKVLGLEDADAITSFFSLPVPKFKMPVESRRKSSKATPEKSQGKKSKSKTKSKGKVKAEEKKKEKVKKPPKPKPLSKEEIAAQKKFEQEQARIMKLEEHQRVIELKKLERERQKEQRILEKKRQIEEKKRQAEYLREYNRPRDDMECDDLLPLPEPTPLTLEHLDSKYFGEIVFVIEFFNIFRFANYCNVNIF